MKRMKLYVPGLFSLLLLFPLFLYKLSEMGFFSQEYVLEVTWYHPEYSLSKVNLPPSKNFLDITLTGDALTDRTKIEYVKVFINEMITQNDTTNGIHIIFADTAKYESFVEILDYCNQQDGLAYGPHESNFWIFNRVKTVEQKNNMTLGQCIVFSYEKVPQEEHNKIAWALGYGFDKKLWPMGLVFVVLVIVNFRRRR